MTVNILTTVKYYEKLLQKVKIDDSVCKIWFSQNLKKVKNLLRLDCRENTVCPLCVHHECALNTLQQLLESRRSVMDAIKTLWGRHVNTAGML